MKKIYCASCPGTGGELVQGMREDGREYLASYCIGLYSKAYFVRRGSKEEERCRYRGFVVRRKSSEMRREVLRLFGFKFLEAENYEVYLKTSLPSAKGLAGSTADIGATAGACLAFLGEKMETEELCRLAAKIEPTDSSFFQNTVLFDPLKGEAVEEFGFLGGMKSLILVPDKALDTRELRARSDYISKKREYRKEVSGLFFELKKAFSDKNRKKVAECAMKSAEFNQNTVRTPYLKEIDEITRFFGGYGLNISHSGTAVCLLLSSSMSEKNILENLRKEGILGYYTSYYSAPVVKGGIMEEEVSWIM